MQFKYYLLSCFVVLLSFTAKAQYYDNGQDPFHTHWKQIKTEHFQVIFSEDIKQEAIRYATYLEQIYPVGSVTLNKRPKPIPVIIHSQTVISNGEVGWAPKRMTFYGVAPQDNYHQPWDQQLVTHEFRHVVQLNKLDQGTTKVLYFLFGEQAIGAVLGLHIPLWFLEGDAVSFETGTSSAGRGRIPDFSMKLEAQTIEKGIYSYHKAVFGSYKDFVPDRYELGYQIVSRANVDFGYSVWESALNSVARVPFYPNAFSRGIKQVTGLSERQLYDKSLSELKDDAQHSIRDKESITMQRITVRSKEYCNYYSPVQLGNRILAYKTSLDDIPRFVSIDNEGNEKLIFRPGVLLDNVFSANDSIIVWNEFKGTRWENKNYSRIAIFNLKTEKERFIERKGRIMSSELSPDGKKIASVEIDNHLQWSITIRDSKHGKLIDSILFDTLQPVQPSWLPNIKSLAFIAVSSRGKSLGIIDLDTHKIRWVLQDEALELSNLVCTQNSIFVKGVHQNASNYYSYQLVDGQWKLLTNVPYGVGKGSCSESGLLFTDYTSDGYRVVRVDSSGFVNLTVDRPEQMQTVMANHLSEVESQVKFHTVFPNYVVEKYSRFWHLINIHSWAPLAIKVDQMEVGPGVTLMSQNVLSTSFLTAGYQYYQGEERNNYFLNYSYKGLFPIINLDYNFDTYPYYKQDNNDTLRKVKFSREAINFSLMFPFTLNQGPYYRRIQPEIGYDYILLHLVPNNWFTSNDINWNFLYYRLYFYNLRRQSARDLQPKWGQVLDIRYHYNPLKSSTSDIGSVQTWQYLPGIIKNQGIRLYAGYQTKHDSSGVFSNHIRFPNGYLYPTNNEALSMAAEYHLPLLYPDLNVGQALYIKRIKASLFYDYSRSMNNQVLTELSSTGIDLTTDFHLFRFIAPIEMGVRYTRRLTMHDNYLEFLFAINFNALY